MPLGMANPGEVVTIQRVGGSAETKKFLENLGFIIGEQVMVLTAAAGNIIVQVKESRVAINSEMAKKIFVTPN